MNKDSTVYGGYCYFPSHPMADLHGIIRFCIRVHSHLSVYTQMDKYGVDLNPRERGKTWGPSNSIVESEVTAQNYGDVYFSSVASAYLSADLYKHDKGQMISLRLESERLAKTEGSKVRASGPSKRKVEFP